MESNEVSNIEKQAEVVNNQGFIPTSKVEFEALPSKGKSYPHTASISLRPYSFGEVKRISDSKLSVGDKLATIVSGINTDFDKSKLTFADITYLGMIRKLNTLGTLSANYPFNCPKCGASNTKVFTQKDIEIEDLEVSELPLVVTMSNGESYEFGPIDYSDMLILDQGRYDKLTSTNNMLTDKVAVYTLLCKNKSFADAYKFFATTTNAEDQEILEEIDKMLNHDVKPLNANCGECKTAVVLPLKNAIDLVLPHRSEEGSIRNRISFGKGTVLSR